MNFRVEICTLPAILRRFQADHGPGIPSRITTRWPAPYRLLWRVERSRTETSGIREISKNLVKYFLRFSWLNSYRLSSLARLHGRLWLLLPYRLKQRQFGEVEERKRPRVNQLRPRSMCYSLSFFGIEVHI